MSLTRGLARNPSESGTTLVVITSGRAIRRTVVLTSTTHKGITLTTEGSTQLTFTYVQNVFRENDTLCLPLSGRAPDATLGAVVICTALRSLHERDEMVWAAIVSAKDRVLSALPEYRPWLLASVGGRDCAATRHKGLVGLMRDEGFKVRSPPFSETCTRRGDGAFYFFGTFDLVERDFAELQGLLTATSRSALALFPTAANPSAVTLAEVGWWRGVSEATEVRDLALQIVAADGVLLRPFGMFDDRLAGVDILARGSQLEALRRGTA